MLNKKTLVAAVIAGTLTACASTPEDPIAASQQIEAQINTFNELKAQLETAKQKHKDRGDLTWFATNEYKKAAEALEETLESFEEFAHDPSLMDESGVFSSTTNRQQFESDLATFNLHYAAAERIKAHALEVMAKAFENRAQLKKIDAASYFAKEAKSVEVQLKKVVDTLAEDKTLSQKKLIALETAQHKLEVKTVDRIYLTPIRTLMAKQKKSRFERQAPIAYASADAAVKSAASIVNASPRDIEAIEIGVNKAKFSLERSAQMVTAVRYLKALPEKRYEQYITSLELQLHKIAQALGLDDLRNTTIAQQAQMILAQTTKAKADFDIQLADIQNSVAADKEHLVAQNTLLTAELSSLKVQIEQLKAAAFEKATVVITEQAAPVTTTEVTQPVVLEEVTELPQTAVVTEETSNQ